MNNVCIRQATIDDLPEMILLLQRGKSDWSDGILKSCFGDTYAHWIVFFEERIAGLITIQKNVNAWEILQVVVDASLRRKKLATQLMHDVIAAAQKNHIHKIQLEVRESNIAAIKLYERCGFTAVGVRKNYYANQENAVLMDCENPRQTCSMS